MTNKALVRIATALGAVLLGGGAIVTGLQAHAEGAPTAALDNRAVAAAHWLGRSSLPASSWKLLSDASGASFYRSLVPGVGSVDLDADTLEVRQVIFDVQLHGSASHRIADGAAISTARQFAGGHYAGFASLIERSVAYVDHGVYQEYRVTWQARQGDAWLPSSVMIGINADTGSLAYYWSRRATVAVSTTPAISADTARTSAAGLAGVSPSTLAAPTLEVVTSARTHSQSLVWVSEIHDASASNGRLHVASFDVVWTDAQTGSSQVVARS